jgi:hypothetical protein
MFAFLQEGPVSSVFTSRQPESLPEAGFRALLKNDYSCHM